MAALIPEKDPKLKNLIRNCLVFSLVMHIAAAWFSMGYHSYDEHFSILEFAGYKLGFEPSSALSWEFPARLRQALQPGIVVCIMKMLGAGADPFTASFLVRLIAALVGWFSLVMVFITGINWIKNNQAKRFFILCTTLLWFFPYQHARFSAESMSGSMFFIGLSCLWLGRHKLKNYLLIIGGFSTGLAFVCRYQTGFMILGLVLWCIFVARFSFWKLLMIAIPAFIAIGIGVLADHWFYGEWVSTAWNYYKINLIQGKASEYGVFPWWTYFSWVTVDLIPPFSLVLMAGILYAFYKNPKNIITFSFVPFLLVHIVIAHKEPRFLFPLINGIPVLLAMAYDQLYLKITKAKKLTEVFFNIFWAVNIFLLFFSSLKPASDQFGLYEFIYHHYNEKSVYLLNKENQPYHLVDFNLYFHKPKDIHLVENVNNEKADSFAEKATGPVLMLYTRQADADNFMKTHPEMKPVYSNIPGWLYHFNFNNWLSRTRVWVLFEMKK